MSVGKRGEEGKGKETVQQLAGYSLRQAAAARIGATGCCRNGQAEKTEFPLSPFGKNGLLMPELSACLSVPPPS
jgi:hypothetical protein